jgi:hypothetical protein
VRPDAVREADGRVELLEARLDFPARVAGLPHGKARGLEPSADLGIASPHADSMHRRPAAPVAAQGDRQVGPPSLVRRGQVVRMLDVELVDEPRPASVRVNSREDSIDERLVADEAVASRSATGDERDRGNAVVHLRRQPEAIAGEVRVLRRAHHLAPAAGDDAHAVRTV